MVAVDVLLVTLAVASVLRVEHLVASDVWIAFCGERWRRRVRQLPKRKLIDPQVMWLHYKQTYGGKLPWLFFGIKSYRLYALATASRDRRLKFMLVWLLRFLWRYYTFVPTMCLIVLVLSFRPSQLREVSRYALLVIASSTLLGMIAIAAEGTLAALFLKSWAIEYHRFPKGHRGSRHSRAARERSVFLGCVLLAYLSAFSLVALVATRFDGYVEFAMTNPLGHQLQDVTRLSLPFFLNNAWADAANSAGFWSNVLVTLLYISYFVIFLTVLQHLEK